MFVKEIGPNQFERLTVGLTIVGPDGIKHPWGITELWSREDLKALNVYRVTHTETPAGKIICGKSTYRKEGDFVIEVLTLQDLPEMPKAESYQLPPPEQPKPLRTIRDEFESAINSDEPGMEFQNEFVQAKERLIRTLNSDIMKLHQRYLEGQQAILYLKMEPEFITKVALLSGQNVNVVEANFKKEHDAFIDFFAELEANRLKTLKGIRAATTMEEAQAAFESFGE